MLGSPFGLLVGCSGQQRLQKPQFLFILVYMARVTVCPLSGDTKVTRQGKSYICLMCLCVNRVSIQSSDFAFFFILLRLGRRQGEWKLTRRLEHHHLCRVLSRPCLFCSPVLQYPQSSLDLSTSQSSLLFLREHIAAQQLNDDVFTSKGSTISTAMHFKYTMVAMMCVKSRGSDFSSTSCLSYNDALISSLKLRSYFSCFTCKQS